MTHTIPDEARIQIRCRRNNQAEAEAFKTHHGNSRTAHHANAKVAETSRNGRSNGRANQETLQSEPGCTRSVSSSRAWASGKQQGPHEDTTLTGHGLAVGEVEQHVRFCGATEAQEAENAKEPCAKKERRKTGVVRETHRRQAHTARTDTRRGTTAR